MPSELIGEFGTSGANREWISAKLLLPSATSSRFCGDPSPEMESKSKGKNMNSVPNVDLSSIPSSRLPQRVAGYPDFIKH